MKIARTVLSGGKDGDNFKVLPMATNEENKGCRELEAKLLNTVHHYHEEVYCRLVSSNLHEKRVLLEYSIQQARGTIEDDGIETGVWIPIHSMELNKEKEKELNNREITSRNREI